MPSKISVALTKAFLAVEGQSAAASRRIHEAVAGLTDQVVAALMRRAGDGRTFHIEDIQDQAELALMRSEHHKVARAYVLYREERARTRDAEHSATKPEAAPALRIKTADGGETALDMSAVAASVETACAGYDGTDAEAVMAEIKRNIYDGMSLDELALAKIMAARVLIEAEPNYAYVSANLLLDKLSGEAHAFVHDSPLAEAFRLCQLFPGLRQTRHRSATARSRNGALRSRQARRRDRASRDRAFQFLGLQTLYDRYLIHSGDTRFEMPQAFFMRVAMGLAVREIDREARAIEFYRLLSSFDFMCSTPTLFNAGTLRPQLSSCFLTSVPDDLDGIFKSVKDNALLSKYAGGLGNDWTRVRGLGAHIKGTNGASQGVVPFLKVANDTAIAVNQGGKRKGAVCAYLETWHIDIEEFLDLRKNTGDDRRRTHDMNTANWVPDLFMQRVKQDGAWTLFSPDEAPDLHDLYGPAFAQAYEALRSQGGARRDDRVQAIARGRSVAAHADHGVRNRPSLDYLQGPVQHPFAAAALRRGAFVEPVHRNHAQYLRRRSRGLQSRLGQPGQSRHA